MKHLESLKILRLWWKIRHKKKINVLRTNNYREFVKEEFEEFYKKCGVVQ